MSKYKIGDKVVLEITDKVEVMGDPWYLLSNATSIYVPYLDKAAETLSTYTEQARAEGQNEAWELARKIILPPSKGGMSSDDYVAIFGNCISEAYVMKNYTYSEAAAKVEAWGKAKEKPQKTILMDLLEKLPNIETEVDGLPKFCPFALGYDVLCSSKKTCKECWNRPLEQIGEE